MGHLSDEDKELQLSNAKTYASLVITDADSCTDGFSGWKSCSMFKDTIINVVSFMNPFSRTSYYILG
ncbi:hypothetical protein CQW23_07739 [Capsicum baccatum]|uniref:Pectinesterase inhibitor domain-containing protein n=1 Tax=Capsicum baccatum TaxID=33114 RepID=A0A2G2X723_CAPBA|nr:hypothetical protein CQW23_07739 [Capsicum baccatum]